MTGLSTTKIWKCSALAYPVLIVGDVKRRMLHRFFHDELPDGLFSKIGDNDFAGVIQYFFVRRTPTELAELRAKAEAAEKSTGDSSEAA